MSSMLVEMLNDMIIVVDSTDEKTKEGQQSSMFSIKYTKLLTKKKRNEVNIHRIFMLSSTYKLIEDVLLNDLVDSCNNLPNIVSLFIILNT